MRSDPILAGPRVFTRNGRQYRITVNGGLRYIRGNSAPYFSLTATQDIAENGFWRDDCGGCMHEAILKLWPKFADLATLHLSNIDGVPSHAGANAWYWLAGCAGGGFGERYHGGSGSSAKSPEECARILGEHLRIDAAETARVIAAVMREACRCDGGPGRPGVVLARAWLYDYVEQQRPRWAAEAAACIARHGLQIYGDHWKGKE